MQTKTARTTLIAAGLAVALGAAGAAPALAAPAPTTHNESMGQAASDTWITTKVKSEFATTSGVSATDISVDTKHGVVILSGTARSNAEKNLAERLARGVKGVKSVDDSGLKVKASGDDD